MKLQMDLKKNKNMLKVLNNIINTFILVLNNINFIQQFFLFLLLIILFIYCVKNFYTRLYLVKIIKKIIICLLFSLILNIFLNNYFTICELSNTKKTLMFLSISTVSALAGITYWVYRNHDRLHHDYLSTITENQIQIKFKFLKVYGTGFVEAKGGIYSQFYNLDKMPMHVLWAKSVGNIFSNIQKNASSLSLKEWLAVSYGFSELNEYYKIYFKNLTYLLNYRIKNPQVFECAYYYYSNPDIAKAITVNPIFYAQEMESFRIAGLLKDLDHQLMSFGGPSNLYYNRKIFSNQISITTEERDLFFSSFAGMEFERYIQIESIPKYTFNLLPSNPQNIINHSFNYIYPFFWVLEKTLGLPNPIPSELFVANWKGNLESYFFNTFPAAFKVTPQDLFDPYIFLDAEKSSNSTLKSKSQNFVCDSINNFKSFCMRYVPKE